MNAYDLKSSGSPGEDLRIWVRASEGRSLAERTLPRAEVDRFVREIETACGEPSADLAALGRRMYDWLNGLGGAWLDGALSESAGLVLRIECEEGLGELPWELLGKDGFLASGRHGLFSPYRIVSEGERPFPPAGRALRIVFAACSPEDVRPVLNTEAEEATVLNGGRLLPVELFFEETGTLEGLAELVGSREPGWFDVLHLTGRIEMSGPEPVFLMENDIGFRKAASPADLVGALAGTPRLICISGREAGVSAGQGGLPLFCRRLAAAGRLSVLGRTLAVGDQSSAVVAAGLFAHLVQGGRLDEAVGLAREQLWRSESKAWHFLRFYSAGAIPEALVDPARAGGLPSPEPKAPPEYLDDIGLVPVGGRMGFVGRRRAVQHGLRVLRSARGDEGYAEGVLLHGRDGMGKSCLASRLCERIETHRRLVWTGRIDEAGLLNRIEEQADLGDSGSFLNHPGLILAQKLRRLLAEPLRERPFLFVFDGFDPNLEHVKGKASLKAEPLHVLKALLAAIRETESASRVVITSRHFFELPRPVRLHALPVEPMSAVEVEKKTVRLPGLHRLMRVDRSHFDRSLVLAEGSPSLIDRLDAVAGLKDFDYETLLANLAQAEPEARNETLTRYLLEGRDQASLRVLAWLSLFELPVSRPVVEAAAGAPVAESLLAELASLGLAQAGLDAPEGETGYIVPWGLRTQAGRVLSEEDVSQGCGRSASYLYQRWRRTPEDDIRWAIEAHRLAILSGDGTTILEIGTLLTHVLNRRAHHRQAATIGRLSVNWGENVRLLTGLGQAERVTGRTSDARGRFERALTIMDRSGRDPGTDLDRAIIQANLAELLATQGESSKALELWQTALPMIRAAGDPETRAGAFVNIAGLMEERGEVEKAQALWENALELLDAMDDPGVKGATLVNLAGLLAKKGRTSRAFRLWRESLDCWEKTGDERGKAAALAAMASLSAAKGDLDRALGFGYEAIEIRRRIRDGRGQADMLVSLAGWEGNQGRRDRQRELHIDAVKVLGDLSAWVELFKVLAILGTTERKDGPVFLAQALRLGIWVGIPVEDFIHVAILLFNQIGPASDLAPLIATAAHYFVQSTSAGHPKKQELEEKTTRLLAACAEVRDVPHKKIGEWFTKKGLDDPEQFIPALTRALEETVGEYNWLFSRKVFKRPTWFSS